VVPDAELALAARLSEVPWLAPTVVDWFVPELTPTLWLVPTVWPTATLWLVPTDCPTATDWLVPTVWPTATLWLVPTLLVAVKLLDWLVPTVEDADEVSEDEAALDADVPDVRPVLLPSVQPLELLVPDPPLATPGTPPPTLLLDPDWLDDPSLVVALDPHEEPLVSVVPSVLLVPEVCEEFTPAVVPAAIDCD
jgi:hypothetical protein